MWGGTILWNPHFLCGQRAFSAMWAHAQQAQRLPRMTCAGVRWHSRLVRGALGAAQPPHRVGMRKQGIVRVCVLHRALVRRTPPLGTHTIWDSTKLAALLHLGFSLPFELGYKGSKLPRDPGSHFNRVGQHTRKSEIRQVTYA